MAKIKMIISNDRDMGELELSYIAARNGNVMAILWEKYQCVHIMLCI